MTPSEVLRKARALIEKPENWTQGASARDAQGRQMWNAREANACARDAIGAIDTAATTHAEQVAARQALWRECVQITVFNDTHTHAEVLSLFDRAIAAAEARGE